MGCKEKDRSEDTQQAVESRQTKLVSESQNTDTSEKIGLRILYAGLPNTDRAKDFVDFLKKHFRQVEITDYNTFTGSHTSEFDVAIIDHDAEAIVLGFNSGKEYGAVGIGRHGNFLHWGYWAPPSQMTEAGKKLFLNCIHYIHKFDGKVPLIRRSSSHR